MVGDMNLDQNRWHGDHYPYKQLAQSVFSCVEQNGLEIKYVGNTYRAFRRTGDGGAIESALDHVYSTVDLPVEVQCLRNSLSDHFRVGENPWLS